MVDMKAKPFYLSEEDCRWVEDTIADMTVDEKIGQLFFNMGSSREEDYLKMTVKDYHIGGIRYNPGTSDEIYEQNRILQENSKIPLIIACNTENGGDGACTDGTTIGSQTKIAATGNAEYAYQLGYMSNREAAAVGCNLSFAPVSDILYNWENPVIGLRTYGNDPKRVAELTEAYMEGAHANPGFCCAAKHFPGDGLDFRDQHVANSVNSMSCKEWDETFGMVYQNLIDNGLEAIMADYKHRMEAAANKEAGAQPLSNREEGAYSDMRVVQEMYARGYEFTPIDIFTAQSRSFQIVDGKLMPSLNSIEGLGDKAADAIVEAVKDGPFLSKDDFRERTRVSKTMVDLMDSLNLLGSLPESNQLSLFDL